MAEIVTLPGIDTAYAIGLSWTHENVRPDAKALRAVATHMHAQWGVVRPTGGAFQAGFCGRIEDERASAVRPLAAVVADVYPAPWLGVFKLGHDEDRYWLIAVRDHQSIVPEGDVVGSQEQINRVRARHLELEWTEYSGDIAELSRFVEAAAKAPVMRDLFASRLRPFFRVLAGAGVVGLVGAGYFAWHAHHRNELAREAAANAARIAAQGAESLRVWKHEPLPQIALDVCKRAWIQQDKFSQGWKVTQWDCAVSEGGADIKAQWTSDGGLAANAPGQLGADGKSSVQSYTVPTKSAASPDDRRDTESAHRAIWKIAQLSGAELKFAVPQGIASATPLPTNLAGGPSSTAEPVSFDTPAPPWLVLDRELSNMPAPGLRISHIVGTPETGQWTSSGNLYSKAVQTPDQQGGASHG